MNSNLSEKVNVLKNKKLLLGLLAMIFGVVVIVITSIIPLIIDPSKWNSAGFISDLIINCAIVIMAMVGMIMVGTSYNAMQKESNIARAIVMFNQSVSELVSPRINDFIQWISAVLEPTDQKDTYKKALRSVKITNLNYLDLSIPQLKALLKEPLKLDNVYFDILTNKQYKVLTDIKNGKYEINFVDAWDWTKNSKYDIEKNHSEKQSSRQKKKTSVMVFQIMGRVFIVIALSLIATALAKDTTAELGVAEIAYKLIARLFNFFTSAFMGFGVGCMINDFDAEYLLDKVEVQKMFVSDKEFKPKTEQELARERFVKYQKETAQIYNVGIEMKGDDK